MSKKAFAVISLLALSGCNITRQNAATVVGDVARTMGADHLKSIRYSGSGYIFSYGQSYQPGGPWPKFNLKSYTRLADYEKGASREETVRTYLDPPELGGSALFIGELRQVAFLSGDRGWNLAANGAPVPAPAESVPVADNVMNAFSVDARQLLLAITPHGWVKAAMDANPTVDTRTVDGKLITVISFTWKGKYKVNGYTNSEKLLEKVETWLPDPVLGDMLVEADYSDYRDFGGVKFPTKIVQKQGGFPVLDLTVSQVQPNAPVDIEVPQAIRDAAPPAVAVESQQVADGVWFLTAPSHNGVIVEFKGYTAVIDAPLNETRSLAVIAEVKKLVPNKPLRYVINTHHHFDHSGGLRTYVAEGATIITHRINRPFFEQTFQLPHTLDPDKLSQNPKPARFETVTDKYILTDGTRTLELHAMKNNTHNPGLLLAYLPKEKILVQADSYTPPTPGLPPPPAVNVINARNLNLEENIEQAHLNVQQILPIHGRIMTIAEFRKAIGKGR